MSEQPTNHDEQPKPRANVATVLQMLHEERMAAATKPTRGDLPSFDSKRSTAKDTLGVMSLDAHIPVCEEFPTADAAFEALISYNERWNARFPLPNGTTQPAPAIEQDEVPF